MPRLVPFGTNGRQTALVFPLGMWDDAKAYYNKLKSQFKRDDDRADSAHAYDVRSGDIVASLPDHLDAVGFANSIQVIYGEYQAWHSTQGTGMKGCLSLPSFVENLKRKGYERYKARPTVGSRTRFLVPSNYADAAGFRDFIASAQASFSTSQHGTHYGSLSTTTQFRAFANRVFKNGLPAKASNSRADDGNMYVSDEDLKNLSQDQLMELARVAVGLRFSGLLG